LKNVPCDLKEFIAALKRLRINMKFASGALKGSGFKPRLTSFSKTYGTAEKPCPFKTPTPGIFPQAVKRCATQGRISPPEIGFSATPWEAVPFREIVASFARCPDGGVRGYVGIATSHAPQIIFLIAVMFSHRIQRETRKSRSA
jgi:hypothetical protein